MGYNQGEDIMKAQIGLGAIAFSGALAFSLAAHAEQSYDITSCFSGTVTMVSTSKELSVYSVDLMGISRSNKDGGAFDNNSIHCVGTGQITPGSSIRSGYCKYMDANGDFVVGRYERGNGEGKWEFVQGTGKWEGIKGGGTNRDVAKAKPITPGTYQACSRATGTFTLPK
jgi:hypothetical protein